VITVYVNTIAQSLLQIYIKRFGFMYFAFHEAFTVMDVWSYWNNLSWI